MLLQLLLPQASSEAHSSAVFGELSGVQAQIRLGQGGKEGRLCLLLACRYFGSPPVHSCSAKATSCAGSVPQVSRSARLEAYMLPTEHPAQSRWVVELTARASCNDSYGRG